MENAVAQIAASFIWLGVWMMDPCWLICLLFLHD